MADSFSAERASYRLNSALRLAVAGLIGSSLLGGPFQRLLRGLLAARFPSPNGSRVRLSHAGRTCLPARRPAAEGLTLPAELSPAFILGTRHQRVQ